MNRNKYMSFLKLAQSTWLLFFVASLSGSFSGSNLGFAYDDNIFWNYKTRSCWKAEQADEQPYKLRVGVNFEYGFDGKARNNRRQGVDFAQIFSATEAYLHSMDNTEDPEVISAELEKLAQPPFSITDSNGEILNYILSIKKIETDLNFWASLEGPTQRNGQLSFSAYFPLKFVNVHSFSATMLPQPDAVQEAIDSVPAIKAELDRIEILSKRNLGGLQLDGWDNDRVWGDLYLMLGWNRTSAWAKPAKTFVNLFAQVGLSIPSADPRDPQSAFSIARGNDNSVGVPVTIGAHATWQESIRTSIAGDFLFLLAEKSPRRLRKTPEQTELLISDKVVAKRDPGMIFRVTGLAELKTPDQIYSGLIGWQFLYKRQDKFSQFETSGYEATIVNASERWQTQYFHNLVFLVGIDFKQLTQSPIAPKITASYKLPITGQRVEMFNALGINLSLSF